MGQIAPLAQVQTVLAGTIMPQVPLTAPHVMIIKLITTTLPPPIPMHHAQQALGQVQQRDVHKTV